MFFANKNKTVIPIILDGHNMEKMFGHTYSDGTGDSLFLLFYIHAPHMHHTLRCAPHYVIEEQGFRGPIVEPVST